MNWKEQFDEWFQLDKPDETTSINSNIKQFIQNEVIKKLLSDIGNEFHERIELDSEIIDLIINPVKDKWLKE